MKYLEPSVFIHRVIHHTIAHYIDSIYQTEFAQYYSPPKVPIALILLRDPRNSAAIF